ncbi:MAG: hypothetical protein AAF488_16835, partial [Planctomycetota bacterium]
MSIAINFGADEPPGVRSDVNGAAGFLGTENWNNIDLASGGPTFLQLDDDGSLDDTDVSVEWTSANTWASQGRSEDNNSAPDGDDRNLMTGYLDTNATDPNRVTVSGLDSVSDGEEYAVFVYMNGGVIGRGGDYQLNDEIRPGIIDTDPFTGDYVEDENYILFTGITGDSFVVTGTPVQVRAPINAIEIVFGGIRGRIRPNRTLNLATSPEECAPGGRGPIDVSITRELDEGDSEATAATVTETINGISAADLTDTEGWTVSEQFPVGVSENGFIRTWLVLGPFQQAGGAAPLEDDIRLDYLTDGADNDEIDVEPRAGDQVETDFGGAAASTGLAANGAGLNPGGIPTWSAHTDLDNTIDYNDVYGGDINQVMMYAVTYFTLEEDRELSLCVGSDDAVQILLDGFEVHLNSVARGVGGVDECQDLVPLGLVEEGTHKLMVKVFEGGGGHGFRVGLQDELTFEVLTDEDFSACPDPDQDPCEFDPFAVTLTTETTFGVLAADGVGYGVNVVEGSVSFAGSVGEDPISGANAADLNCDTSPTNLACVLNAEGGVDATWENSPFAGDEDIVITANGNEVATVSSDSTSTTVNADAFDIPWASICVSNSDGSVCCSLLLSGLNAADYLGGGDGTGTADETIIGINLDTGLFE